MGFSFSLRPTVLAKIGGNLVPYDACGSTKDTDFYPPDKWEYLGEGIIYSVDGVVQTFTEKMHFFKLKITDNEFQL